MAASAATETSPAIPGMSLSWCRSGHPAVDVGWIPACAGMTEVSAKSLLHRHCRHGEAIPLPVGSNQEIASSPCSLQ